MSYLPKLSRTILNVSLALSLILLSLITPVAVQASAPSITALSNPILYDINNQTLGRIKVVVPAGAIKENDVMVVKVPYTLNNGMSSEIFNEDTVNSSTELNYMFVPKNNNGLQNDNFSITSISGNEFKITATADASFSNDTVFYLFFNGVNIKSGDEGPIVINFSSPEASGFPTGSVVAGTAVHKGLVEISSEEIVKSNQFFSFKLRLKEDIYKSLESGNNSIKIKLPKGYQWKTPVAGSEKTIYGEKLSFTYSTTENELLIHVTSGQTSIPSMWEIPLEFSVLDDYIVTTGDVIAQINGTTNLNNKELKVGEYAEYGTSISIKDVPKLASGKTEQDIGMIEIQERVPGSLIANRSLYLTVPDGVKWVDYDTDRDGVNLGIPSLTNDGRSLKYTLTGRNADIAKLKLDDLKVAIQPGFTGPLKLDIEGAGVEKQMLTVATVIEPVSVTTSTVPDVKVGMTKQSASDIILTENRKEAFKKGGTVEINLPSGVDFNYDPKVEITKGNLFIKNIRYESNKLRFEIDEESTVPSTITISNVNLRIDRTVPEGKITVDIKGSALIETMDTYVLNQTTYHLWSNKHTYANLGIANVTTPAPGKSTRETAVFTLGSTTYKIGNLVKTMDIEPFVDKGRTYLPVRFSADAIGVNMDHVIWDNDARTVTILRESRVVQLTIGSNILTVNGVQVMMDVPAQIKNDRTILPIRFVAQAIGAQVDFNNSTRTVTIR